MASEAVNTYPEKPSYSVIQYNRYNRLNDRTQFAVTTILF